MGIFTAGDVIVLIIVVVTLFIFRFLDKNNRSLEKVKRYAEKVKGDLGLFIENQSAGLKNMNIELDIHQKTSKEVLKRIAEYEGGFEDRFHIFEELKQKIGEYDNALRELNSMSARVNDNLQQLHQEAEFVDKIGQKMKTASAQITQVEKKIPQITEEFKVINEKSFKSLGKNAVQQVKENIQHAVEEVNNASARIDDFSETLSDLERKAVELEDETLTSIQQKSIRIVSNADDEIDKVKQDLSEMIEDFKTQSDVLEQSYQASLVEASAKGKEIEGEVFKSFKHFIETKAEENKSNLVQYIDQKNGDTDERLDSYDQKISEWKENTTKEISDFVLSMKEQYSTISEEALTRGEKVKNTVQHLGEGIEKWKADMLSKLDSSSGVYDKKFESLLSEAKKAADKMLLLVDKKVHSYDVIITKQQSAVERWQNDMLGKFNKDGSVYNKKFEEMMGMIKNDAQGLLTQIDQKVMSYDDVIGRKQSEVDAKLAAYDAIIDDKQDAVDSWKEQMKQSLEAENAQFNEQLKLMVVDAGKSMDEARDLVNGKMAEYQQTITDQAASTDVWRTSIHQSLEAENVQFNEQLKLMVVESGKSMEESSAHVHLRMTEYQQSIQEQSSSIDEWRDNMHQALEAEKALAAERVQAMTKSANDTVNQLLEATKEKLSGMNTQIELKESEFGESINNLENKNTEVIASLSDNLASGMNEITIKIENTFADLDSQVQNYEGDISYRLTKIEEVGTDIDALEDSLRQSMEIAVDKLKDNFKIYEVSIDQLRADGMQKAENDVTHINKVISKLETELTDLKTKAYENVSEKLQVFEDDFFNDLKNRNEKIDLELVKLQDNVKSDIDDIVAEEAEKRVVVEKEYTEELRNGLSDVQNKTFATYEKFEDQVTGFQNRIDERMNITESSMKGLEEGLRQEIIDTRNNANSYFQKEFTEQTAAMADLIKKAEREMDTEISALTNEFDEKRKEISGTIDITQSDITVWQAKVLQEMNEAKDNLNGDFDLFKTDVGMTIGSIKEDFHKQKDEFFLANQEERNAMKKEITELSEQILDLENDLRKRTETALETFEQNFSTFSFDHQKKSKDFQTEIDQRIKDYRISAKEIQDKIDGIQKKLYGRVEENYHTLSVTLQEIDKKQKNFVNQTKLFDRADTLKHSLSENIEDLKSEVARVDSSRTEIKETEKRFTKIIKMGDEANAKVNSFIQEKRRIEDMDSDFKKLLNISQAVDVKLDQLTTNHDTLQDIQVRIRKLEELAKDVELKYDRLEKKDNILESTVDGVDANFQQLGDLEKGLDKLQIRMDEAVGELNLAADKIEVLAANKSDAEAAIQQVNELSSILKDVESRMDEMQKAREWLAGTETRLEEINKQAQEQVKLLGTIMKEPGGKNGDRGAPGMNAREVVKRLSHQGWNVKEICKATKLSRGEVELILELLP